MTEKMWGGRFREPLHPTFERWQRSLDFDRRLIVYEVEASRGYAHALERAGVLSAEEGSRIEEGLRAVLGKVGADPTVFDRSTAEDVHDFLEKHLVAEIGELGYKLHTGRSRNEQVATDLRLCVRRSLGAIHARLTQLIEVLLAHGKKLGDTSMPAYTHQQRAEPVLAAHWLLAYAEMFFRDAERLADCRKRVNTLPLGSGAVAGASVALDRAALATALGFDRVSANSIDATSDRDFLLEFLHALTIVTLHLSRWAEEMILFSTAEYGFVRLPDGYTTGSSAMPQKKNPDAFELLRGEAGTVLARAVEVAVILKGLPLAYNKDLQLTQLALYRATDTVVAGLDVAAEVAAELQFDTDRMQAAASTGFLNAMAAAMYLAHRGVPFRQAHTAVGQAVLHCLETGKTLEALTLDELRRFHPEFDNGFYEAVKLETVLASHDVPGGTAPARVKQALVEAEQRLKALKEELSAHA